MIISFGKTLVWLLYIVFVATIQLFIVTAFNKTFNISEFIVNGFFLFLSVGSISAICYEFLMESNIVPGRYLSFTNIFIAIILTGISMLLYSAVYVDFYQKNHYRDYDNFISTYKIPVVGINAAIIISTLLFLSLLKTALYERKRLDS